MAPGPVDPFFESRIYAVLRTLRRWTATSTLFSLLGSERVLLGGLAGFVLLSVVSVFDSNLGAGVKFLSFALLFVCLAALIDRFVDPPTE